MLHLSRGDYAVLKQNQNWNYNRQLLQSETILTIHVFVSETILSSYHSVFLYAIA